MPIPDVNRAVVEDLKVHDYLLNLGNPDGGSKAVWFHSLGYCRGAWHYLATDLLAVAKSCPNFDIESTQLGVNTRLEGLLADPNIVLPWF